MGLTMEAMPQAATWHSACATDPRLAAEDDPLKRVAARRRYAAQLAPPGESAPAVARSISSTSAIVGVSPRSQSEVTPCSAMPQGTMPP